MGEHKSNVVNSNKRSSNTSY